MEALEIYFAVAVIVTVVVIIFNNVVAVDIVAVFVKAAAELFCGL